jgi:hypothetical protein
MDASLYRHQGPLMCSPTSFPVSLLSLIAFPLLVGVTSVSVQGSRDLYPNGMVEFGPVGPSDNGSSDPDTLPEPLIPARPH